MSGSHARPSQAAELAHRLSRNAEAVCRHYLFNGRREGNYWLVGNVTNAPGRSLFVRLNGPEHGKGAAGKWTDAATHEHGDLLDLIAKNRGLNRLRDVLDEARSFLSLPRVAPGPAGRECRPPGSSDAARRLFAMAQPIAGTIAEAYLRSRGITALYGTDALRFHPRCYYRPDADAPTETWPALIAAVTDLHGKITGAHRTWLDPSGEDKAPIDTPRRAMGQLLGHGVRFGVAHDVIAAGEGIETMLSLRSVLPALPMLAALSANHLAAILFPATLRRLYIARDHDPAGDAALASLSARAEAAGIEALTLSPTLGDFNEDLRHFGMSDLRAGLRVQFAPEDVARFMAWAMTGTE
ncbi:MAG TPA: toprim domain-containing protein [Stellaceae bacterium]|nr:toprim domain-containing protein [Stellaceae bacterium]